ncbi:MAG: hypothetical protein ABI333_19835 [bacterium]
MTDDPPARVNLLPDGSPEPDESDKAHEIATRLHALPEPPMRGAVLAELLIGLPLAEAAAVISAIVQRGRQGGPPFELALSGLEELLRTERLPYERLCDLYRVLKADQLGDLATLLLPGQQHREILGAKSPAFPAGRDLTLGERKSLARAAPRDTLARLLRDPEPQVIRLLLRNPRLVERDVVLVASRRPVQPEVIREVMANPKWLSRYAVKRTIILNPGTPNELAIRLLPFMTQTHLREISADPALPEIRRDAAQRLLQGAPGQRR